MNIATTIQPEDRPGSASEWGFQVLGRLDINDSGIHPCWGNEPGKPEGEGPESAEEL